MNRKHSANRTALETSLVKLRKKSQAYKQTHFNKERTMRGGGEKKNG